MAGPATFVGALLSFLHPIVASERQARFFQAREEHSLPGMSQQKNVMPMNGPLVSGRANNRVYEWEGTRPYMFIGKTDGSLITVCHVTRKRSVNCSLLRGVSLVARERFARVPPPGHARARRGNCIHARPKERSRRKLHSSLETRGESPVARDTPTNLVLRRPAKILIIPREVAKLSVGDGIRGAS